MSLPTRFNEFITQTREFIEQVSNDIKNLFVRVSNMEDADFVGGVNYVSPHLDNSDYEGFHIINNAFASMYIGTIDVNSGHNLWNQNVTLSVVVKSSTHPFTFYVLGSSRVSSLIYAPPSSGESHKISINFNTSNFNSAKIGFQPIGAGQGEAYIEFGKLMLEKGDLSSEWVPEFEDFFPDYDRSVSNIQFITSGQVNVYNGSVIFMQNAISFNTTSDQAGGRFTIVAQNNGLVSLNSPLKLYKKSPTNDILVLVGNLQRGNAYHFIITGAANNLNAQLIGTSEL